nr:DUF1848 domain-containing protein [uncultured Aminipila sp.]
MIISASRRTDIPNYYFDWFTNRLKERFVLVSNPMNYNQVSKIDLSPEVVDCIVFWTKNPAPMLDSIKQLKDYNYYFQFTLTSYGSDMEINVPSKSRNLIDTFKRLSDQIGPEKVIWRYDPILMNNKYNQEYHMEYFAKIARELGHYTEKCIFSFIDFYPKIKTSLTEMGASEPDDLEKLAMVKTLQKITQQYGLDLETCAENMDLSHIGINHGKCIDDVLIERITGYPIISKKDKNQRMECGCIESIDIGAYDTCRNGCKYCYANHSPVTVGNKIQNYEVNSPILCSTITENDRIKERKAESGKQEQLLLKL